MNLIIFDGFVIHFPVGVALFKILTLENRLVNFSQKKRHDTRA